MQTSSEESTVPPIMGAGFWVRSVAHVVDSFLLTLLGIVLTIPILLAQLEVNAWINWGSNLLSAAIVILFWRYLQATPGKMMMKLKIVDLRTGERPSFPRLMVRYVAYFISILPILPFKWIAPDLATLPYVGETYAGYMEGPFWWIFGVPLGFGFFWVMIDKQHRGWHDLISGTVTISTSKD